VYIDILKGNQIKASNVPTLLQQAREVLLKNAEAILLQSPSKKFYVINRLTKLTHGIQLVNKKAEVGGGASIGVDASLGMAKIKFAASSNTSTSTTALKTEGDEPLIVGVALSELFMKKVNGKMVISRAKEQTPEKHHAPAAVTEYSIGVTENVDFAQLETSQNH